MPNLTQSAGVLQIRKKARAGRTHFLGREGQDERLENPYRCGARRLGGGTAKFRHSRVVSDFQQTTFALNGSTCLPGVGLVEGKTIFRKAPAAVACDLSTCRRKSV